ncbi:hypothetical protein [Granulicella tundricola]|uniref:FlgO domain-containing protein n=1 Tax=Granulicella tundricola (strain ATCC BAA-1859 / DSM 23138 / MP5ACTX9) TaxID=1198114 RepID=E8X4U3_GRATM|nr:hypothetical protein [Granulicella tundricola]ADW70582.1 hypothetical protein AciX9_3578 [Granulicella tundricola MP5ACTX9]
MRALIGSIASAAVLLSSGMIAYGQAYGGPNGGPPMPPPPPPIEQTIATLADQPATHSGFVFDRTMLQVAQSMLESNGMDARRAAVALTAISFDSYRYSQPAFYSPEAMSGLVEQYRAMGWKHMVNANQTPQNTAQPRAMVTDMWLHFSGADIDGVTVLTRSSRDMNLVQVHGDLRPLDLLHLGGHFGIPKVDPNAVMVPAR